MIENPAGKYCLLSKKPIIIPFEFLLAVDVGHDAVEVRSKNTRKVFDMQVTAKNLKMYKRQKIRENLLTFKLSSAALHSI